MSQKPLFNSSTQNILHLPRSVTLFQITHVSWNAAVSLVARIVCFLPISRSYCTRTILVTRDVHRHDDVIKWKHFPRYWPFVRGIHRSRWIPHTKASDGALMFSLICVWINCWVNSREAGDLRRHRGHYDVSVMKNFYFNPKSAGPGVSRSSWSIPCQLMLWLRASYGHQLLIWNRQAFIFIKDDFQLIGPWEMQV